MPFDEISDLNSREKIQKVLAQRVCICKGISLAAVLKAVESEDTLEGVNERTGCGSGGCKGQRCSPKILALLRKVRKPD